MNPARGEVPLMIDGDRRTLCLTLGALAEIEAGLGCDGFAALGMQLKQLTAADLVLVVQALLKGGEGVSADLSGARIDPADAARAVADCFEAAL
ncbi:GTA-gp10 family protein [Hyphobacterium sp.]|uniref:GTA-gp10 family protein n=1 Tax=Hyphobacterium sp. TaxID=2004662 RepID=UPI003B5226D5